MPNNNDSSIALGQSTASDATLAQFSSADTTTLDNAASPSLDGAWFRRERERLAISRRAVGEQLGLKENHISRLEFWKRAVPLEWLDVVERLGFRIPRAIEGGSTAQSAAAEKGAASMPSPTQSPAVTVLDQAAVPNLHTPSSPDAMSAPKPMPSQSGSQAATAAVEQKPQTPAVPPAELAAESQVPSLAEDMRGLWLRTRRYELNLSLKALSTALQTAQHDLSMVEGNDLLIPPSWIPTLKALRFCEPSGLTREPQARRSAALNGHWIQTQRQTAGYSIAYLSEHLRVNPSALALVELRGWPVPPEWLSTLAALGLSAPEPRLADVKGAVPGSPFKPLGLSGLWLQNERQKRSITQPVLSDYLRVDKDVIASCEQNDWPLPRKWSEPLLALGFPVLEESSLTLVASPPRKVAFHPSTSPPVASHETKKTGAPLPKHWLRTERNRLNLSQTEVGQQLGVPQTVVSMAERGKRAIPSPWIPILKQLGFLLPSASPSLPPSETLNGQWLERHRKRLKRSIPYISSQIKVTTRALRGAERRNEALPLAWLPGLKRIGFPVPPHLLAPEERPQSPTDKPAPAQPRAKAPQPVSGPAETESRMPAAQSADPADVVDLVIEYRLKLGRRLGHSPLYVLSSIFGDLREAGIGASMTYDDVKAAVQSILRLAVKSTSSAG